MMTSHGVLIGASFVPEWNRRPEYSCSHRIIRLVGTSMIRVIKNHDSSHSADGILAGCSMHESVI